MDRDRPESHEHHAGAGRHEEHGDHHATAHTDQAVRGAGVQARLEERQ